MAVGALLLVALQCRKSWKRASKEVHVDGDGNEVVRLKGPWQVHELPFLFLAPRMKFSSGSRSWGFTSTQHVSSLGLYQLSSITSLVSPNRFSTLRFRVQQ